MVDQNVDQSKLPGASFSTRRTLDKNSPLFADWAICFAAVAASSGIAAG
jgi:hypothetical protein